MAFSDFYWPCVAILWLSVWSYHAGVHRRVYTRYEDLRDYLFLETSDLAIERAKLKAQPTSNTPTSKTISYTPSSFGDDTLHVHIDNTEALDSTSSPSSDTIMHDVDSNADSRALESPATINITIDWSDAPTSSSHRHQSPSLRLQQVSVEFEDTSGQPRPIDITVRGPSYGRASD